MKYLLIAAALISLSCSEGITRKIAPAKRLDIDSSGSRSTIRSLSFDCSLYLLGDDERAQLKQIVSDDKNLNSDSERIYFLAIIRNHEDLPIPLPAFFMQTGKEKNADKQPIPLLPEIFRTFSDVIELEDFTESAVPYRFSFILPDDSIACIGSIQIPYGFSNFTISLSIPIQGREKIIAFDYTRTDYRQNGGSY